jgi:uncharacterized protein YfaS (alpha-2-macroglobulin family)
MQRRRNLLALGFLLVLTASAAWLLNSVTSAPPTPEQRQKLVKMATDGNYKDAYDGLRKLALNPDDDPKQAGADLELAIQCLRNLGRVDEIDAFRAGVIDVHKKNWRLLHTAARTFLHGDHYGFIVAGEFHRGNHRGGGRYVNSYPRDHVRALQLMNQALPFIKDETNKPDVATYYLSFAEMFLGLGHQNAWRLQVLTDLGQLPDYEDGDFWFHGNGRGAPVDADGKPVFHQLPKGFDVAKSDGERWRWMLAQAAAANPGRASEIDMIFATFQMSQFGEQTIAYRGYTLPDDEKKDTSGTFALHTLGDDETIAWLANGVKRFKLPDEFNWIKIYQKVASRGKSPSGEQARDSLAGVFENRRQYLKAEEAWKKAIEEYGTGNNNFRQQRLNQIVGNWGRFEPIQTQAAGSNATIDYRYRNGSKVSFEAHAIKVPQLLEDVKAYLKGKPGQVDWQRINVQDIGYRLVFQNEKQYLGDKVAAWSTDLKPRPRHLDDRITVSTPLDKPGAYLLTAQMQNGNTSRIIVWVADTVILKKQMSGEVFYYVGDAVTGQPVPEAELDFFGYRMNHLGNNQWQVSTSAANGKSDADGQLRMNDGKQPHDHQWLITARKKGANGGADRFAYLGFTNVWYNREHDPVYNQTKVFTITDRPVYRPQQQVHFKMWVGQAKYDVQDNTAFAGKAFTVRIHNPKGEKVYDKALTADEFGGIAGDYTLPAGATLGMYNIQIENHWPGSSFRVEEYKKPEFEVKVEAPKEPVRLGEQVTATIEAKYYFGAPVTKAKVKYKVMRTSHSSRWFPRGTWDWFYGSGYWWFAADYRWYPGFGDWGCLRPVPWWWHNWNQEQPELVMENDVEIGPDGKVQVQIDTKPAKELHGDTDHSYAITAEVVDESRRTIVGTGNVLVSRKPFAVYTWLDRGHYRTGDTVKAYFDAHTIDHKPVAGKGELSLYKISYDVKNKPVEQSVGTWKLDTDVEGHAQQQIAASAPGQYRLSFKVTDSQKHTIEGGYVFVVRGEGFDGRQYRFNDIELITDKREYAPGDKAKLLVNTNRNGGTVLLFLRPAGTYFAPKLLKLKGKSVEEEIEIVQRDMPNIFVEAVTVADGRVHTDVRELVVPPEKRVVNVEVLPSQKEYKPGQQAKVKVKLTDLALKPFIGSTVVSVYDKSVEYISGGSNVPEIREFFWKWRRQHHPQTESTLDRFFNNAYRQGETAMANLGIFGELVADEVHDGNDVASNWNMERRKGMNAAPGAGFGAMRGAGRRELGALRDGDFDRLEEQAKRADDKAPAGEPPPAPPSEQPGAAGGVEPTVRKNFADTAFWSAAVTTDKDGIAEFTVKMPENLTGWRVKVWAMGQGTRVGQGDAEVTTKKDLLVRLQAPRFFTQKDEVVLSANVHNYLKTAKNVAVSLEMPGNVLSPIDPPLRQVRIEPNGELRVDWRVRVLSEGEAVVRMKAISDEDSDAMEMRFPSYVHGMLKTDSFSGVVRLDKDSASITFTVPDERRINESRLEVRYSPTLAGAMVDALPYMVEYPYGCTEQTLNRFLPTVITQNVLKKMNLNLKAIQEKRTNLNAQEIGDAQARARGWKRFDRNPVFDEAEVHAMTDAGVARLASMQCSDGGWGWFSGWGEHSYPHTTAVVVHGLQRVKLAGVTLPQGMLERGVAWLKRYQDEQVQWIRNAVSQTRPYKDNADNLDAMVYMVLVDEKTSNEAMRDFLYRDRTKLGVYAKAMFGLALFAEQQADKLAMILQNISQFVVQDDENQTAYLRLPADNQWWYWYGSEIEADAYYLKLLAKTDPKGKTASRLVKYLLNNRKHSTYWNSTRDTAICIEAMADYMAASGEDKPDMTVEVWLDGKKHKEVKINSENLFTFDNQFVLFGDAVESGKHTLEVKRKGTGPVYFNAYVTNFTMEDFITKAGLEVKVNRKYYKLTKVDKEVKVSGSSGHAVGQKVEKYERKELPNLASLKSGDLVEIELEIDSKNDYEYILFEDPKAAGFEPMEVRSGYVPNTMGAYMELRDERVCFFVRALARGKHSISYRMRAEIPGKFSALPTRAYAMYAPELKGNSDEIKLAITD